MLRRLVVPASVLLGIALMAACGGGSREQEIRSGLAAIEDAINRGDGASLFDEFSDADCKGSFSRDVFIANFEQARFQISDVTLSDENIQIEDDTAHIILTATFTFADGRQETRTFFETLVKAVETGRWRDQDCFQGGLGGRSAADEITARLGPGRWAVP